ncbi:hypothetical protein MKX08_007550 [Trichoderma sp. CBMAI-0020]|nr:hypothetical protein MKX08_007550 [Trichoderma sp. CBMAI-0020]
MSKATSSSHEASGTSRDSLWFSWKAVLACVLLAALASFQLNKTLSSQPLSLRSTNNKDQPLSVQTTNNKETLSGSRRVLGAHVVTRPNPEVIGSNQDETAHSSIQLLQAASRSWTVFPEDAEDVRTNKPIGPESRKIMHDSFADVDQNPESKVVPYGGGLVEGIIRAFQQDLHLVLRPDDIWLAITTQLSFYINSHAEELRHLFVTHEGQKELVLDLTPLSMEELDMAYAAVLFSQLIQKNVVDPELASWMLPNFTTSTTNDVSVAAMVMMATTKKYFEYIIGIGCGFPSVTLLGEREDWVNLLERLPKLAKFGDEPKEWSKLLIKVVEKMIETYDRPDDQSIKDFWMKAVHKTGFEGSGMGLKSLSGWTTAFCFWDGEGNKIHQYTDEEIPISLYHHEDPKERKRFFIDDVAFPIIRAESVPKAVVEVPVKVIDKSTMTKYYTTVIAGSIGMAATTSENQTVFDTFQPQSGWWMLLDKTEPIV